MKKGDFNELALVLPEPVLLVTESGRILTGNPAATRFFSLPLSKLTSSQLSDLVTPTFDVGAFLARCARSRHMTPATAHMRSAAGEGLAIRMEGAVLVPWSSEAPAQIFLRFLSQEQATTRFTLLNKKIEALSSEIHRRMQAEDALRALQVELEQRVDRRTAQLAQANNELEQSNRALQEFAFVASHDLQEPLRKIQVLGAQLTKHAGSRLDERSTGYLERMTDAASRMQTLVQDLLQLSRVTSDPPRFKQVDLSAVARQVVADLEDRIEKTQGQVEISRLPVIEADEQRMHQLFQNLISNALKFHREDESPHVRVFESADESPLEKNGKGSHEVCHISVQDSGIGFDEKDLDRIFNIFTRLHGRGQYEGSGIGLAICRRIAEQHDGSITAMSRSGQGATFIVSLPVHQIKAKSSRNTAA